MDDPTTEYMLTTIDNPFSPFSDFDEWFAFDVEKGYNSCGLLDRFSYTSNELSEKENQDELNRAIDRILELDLTGMYRKVKKTDFKKDDASENT